jgi:hypothetical protein
MKLPVREFKAMSSSFRRFLQRTVAYPLFRRWGWISRMLTRWELGAALHMALA